MRERRLPLLERIIMKLRNSFVANSSSSSYIIAYKGDVLKQIQEMQRENSITRFLFSPLVWMIHNAKDNEVIESTDYGDYNISELIQKGFQIMVGYADSYGDDAEETYVAESEIDINTDDLIIWKEGL